MKTTISLSLGVISILLSLCAATSLGQPQITSFSPTSGRVGTNVTIAGTNFEPTPTNNIVYFGAVRGSVLSANATNLLVTVPAGATYAPITVTVNGLVAYANQPFSPTFLGDGSSVSSSSFGPRQDVSLTGAFRTAIADLDGDGKPDLVVLDTANPSLVLFRNISTGGALDAASFAPPVTVPLPGSQIMWLTVADVDGDGKLDLVVCDYQTNHVLVCRNLSVPGSLTTNSFAPAVTFTVGQTPRNVRVRDLDGDGKPDNVTVNWSGTVSILQNVGVAGILNSNSFAPHFDLPGASIPQGLAIGDLDGDGKPDLAVGDGNVVSIFRNLSTPGALGTNSFAPRVDLPATAWDNSVEIADIDGDGKPDLIAGGYDGQTLSVYRNISGPGSLTVNSFEPRVDFAANGRITDIALADINGDGKPDIALVTELNSTMSVFENLSAPGTFTSASLGTRVDFATGYKAVSISVGDLNGDGVPDVVFCNVYDNTFSMYQNVSPFGGPPAIITQPQSLTVNAHSNATISVSVLGSQLNYQWSLNGTNIQGAVSSSLTITNVTPDALGSYSVLVTNSFGSTTSSNAILSMYPYLNVTFGGAVVYWGGDATFSVQAWGSGPLSFQWYKDGTAIPYATNQTFSLTNIQTTNAGMYSVVVTGPFGSVTNAPEQVIVNPAGVSLGMYPGVTVTGVVGLTYDIQSTTDLRDTNAWTTVATITLVQPVQLWVDVNVNVASPDHPRRFYRVFPAQ